MGFEDNGMIKDFGKLDQINAVDPLGQKEVAGRLAQDSAVDDKTCRRSPLEETYTIYFDAAEHAALWGMAGHGIAGKGGFIGGVLGGLYMGFEIGVEHNKAIELDCLKKNHKISE